MLSFTFHVVLPAMRVAQYPDGPFLPRLLRELWLDMLDSFDIETLLRIRATNSIGDGYTSATLYHRLHRYLHHAVDYDSFVAALEDTGAVLGGYGALRILYPSPGDPPPHSAHLFAPRSTYGRLVQHLTVVQGFTVCPEGLEDAALHGASDDDGSDDGEGPDGHGDSPVPRVLATAVLTKGDFRITVTQSMLECPLHAMTSEWNSALFTYISPRDFCSAYSRLNADSRALLNPVRLKDFSVMPKSLKRDLAAWKKDGWNVAQEWMPWSPGPCAGALSEGCSAATRFFGDRFCCRGAVSITLRDGDGKHGYHDGWRRESCMWWRGGAVCGRSCHGRMRFIVPGVRVCHRSLLIGL